MTMPTHAMEDSATMLRRNLRHMQRYPSLTLMLVGMPIVFLLLFVYVLGGTMGAGLDGVNGGRAQYLTYVVPGILMIAVTAVAQGTAISVAMDMTQGIIDRFRTMAISRAAVLTGHVVGAMIQTLGCLAIVLGVAVSIGFRPMAGPLQWLGAIAMLALIAFALTWFTVALGLRAKSVETASNSPMPLMLLPLFGSGFVPARTMPAGLRWFAAHQPFTPMIETVRGLLMGTPIGHSAIIASAWCIAIGTFGYMRARAAYDRRAVR